MRRPLLRHTAASLRLLACVVAALLGALVWRLALSYGRPAFVYYDHGTSFFDEGVKFVLWDDGTGFAYQHHEAVELALSADEFDEVLGVFRRHRFFLMRSAEETSTDGDGTDLYLAADGLCRHVSRYPSKPSIGAALEDVLRPAVLAGRSVPLQVALERSRDHLEAATPGSAVHACARRALDDFLRGPAQQEPLPAELRRSLDIPRGEAH